MTCITSAKRSELIAQRETKQKQLDAANDALEKILDPDRGHIQKYTLDTGEGRQSTTLSDPLKIQELIESLEQQIARIDKRLNGTGLVALNFRRR